MNTRRKHSQSPSYRSRQFLPGVLSTGLATLLLATSASAQSRTIRSLNGGQPAKRPSIQSVAPLSGTVGDEIVIQGQNLDTPNPGDLLLLGQGVRFDVESVQDTEVRARVLFVDPNAQPSVLYLLKGMGGDAIIPDSNGMTATGAYAHCAKIKDRANWTLSEHTFTPIPPTNASPQGSCDAPGSMRCYYWRNQGDDVVLDLPWQWCPNDRARLELCFERFPHGDFTRIEEFDFGPDPINASPFVRGLYLALALQTAMSAASIPCNVLYDPSLNQLKVSCSSNIDLWDSPLASCFNRLCVQFGDTAVTEYHDEVHDDFVSPTPTHLVSGSLYEQWVFDNCPGGSSEMFDEADSNRCFAHTIEFPPGEVIGAMLEIRVRAHSDVPTNDAIFLEYNDGSSPTFKWVGGLASLTGLDWENGDTAILCLDLNALPQSSGGSLSLISAIEDGQLDILVNDDSVVDYVKLSVRRCQ